MSTGQSYSFLSLPEDLLRAEIFTFLTVEDVSCVDIAVCNHYLRGQLFRLYSTITMEHTRRGFNNIQLKWFDHRSIKLYGIYLDRDDLSATEIAALFSELQHCKFTAQFLLKISAVAVKELTDATLQILCKSNFASLTSINFSQCVNVSDFGIVSLLRKRPNLVDINFSFCYENITEVAIFGICLYTPNLQRLDLTSCKHITDDTMFVVAMTCKWIEELDLSGCGRITDKTVTAAAFGFTNLRRLTLWFCHDTITQQSAESIVTACRVLKKLDIRYCNGISESTKALLLSALPSKGCTVLIEGYQHGTY